MRRCLGFLCGQSWRGPLVYSNVVCSWEKMSTNGLKLDQASALVVGEMSCQSFNYNQNTTHNLQSTIVEVGHHDFQHILNIIMGEISRSLRKTTETVYIYQCCSKCAQVFLTQVKPRNFFLISLKVHRNAVLGV